MRRYIYYLFIYAALTAAAVSCEYDFELKGMPQEPCLYIECLPGESDTTFIYLHAAVPVGNGAAAVPENLADAAVSFSVNGETRDVTLHRTGESEAVFCSPYIAKGGDRLAMSASLEGFPSVSSSTVIPATVPDFDVKMEKRDRDLIITVTIRDDNPQEDDYYCVNFVKREKIIDYRGERTNTECYQCELTDSKEYPNMVNSGIMVMHEDTDRECYVFSDKEKAADGTKSISIKGYYEENTLYVDSDTGEIQLSRDYKYMVECKRLSPEAFFYYRSRYDIDWNDLAYLGWAPANFAYTNIDGGVGVFGGAAKASSGWLDNI